MAYKYTKGTTYQGDIKAKIDPERNSGKSNGCFIDFDTMWDSRLLMYVIFLIMSWDYQILLNIITKKY